MPAGVTLVSASPGGILNAASTVVSFALGTLNAGASAMMSVVVMPTTAGTLTNVTQVLGQQPNPNPARSTFTLMTLVQSAPPVTPTGPTVLSVRRFGYHRMPTSIVLSFSENLNTARAEDVHNYRLAALGRHGRYRPSGAAIGFRAAIYDPSARTVTLYPDQLVNLHKPYQLTVNGSSPTGVAGVNGDLLDGQNNGQPGGDFVTTLLGFGPDEPVSPSRRKTVSRRVLALVVPNRLSTRVVAEPLARKARSSALERA